MLNDLSTFMPITCDAVGCHNRKKKGELTQSTLRVGEPQLVA